MLALRWAERRHACSWRGRREGMLAAGVVQLLNITVSVRVRGLVQLLDIRVRVRVRGLVQLLDIVCIGILPT